MSELNMCQLSMESKTWTTGGILLVIGVTICQLTHCRLWSDVTLYYFEGRLGIYSLNNSS